MANSPDAVATTDRSWSGVAEPDADRGDVDDALVDAFTFVIAGATALNCLSLQMQRPTVLRFRMPRPAYRKPF
jgi:hypothetical protein